MKTKIKITITRGGDSAGLSGAGVRGLGEEAVPVLFGVADPRGGIAARKRVGWKEFAREIIAGERS